MNQATPPTTAGRERAAALVLELFATALRERSGGAVTLAPPTPVAGFDAWTVAGRAGERSLALALVMLAPPAGEGAWHAARTALEERLSAGLSGGYLLWVPPGAELSAREPQRSDLILRVEEAAARLVPGGHTEVRFPVSLTLRKSDEEGSYLTARGGLAFAWAQFTNRVAGHYQLDSTELHRLPRGDGYLRELVDGIAAVANTLTLGQTVAIPAEDAWTLTHLPAGEGVTIVGEPPGAEGGSGAPLRRGLRRTLAALREPLAALAAEARVVAITGAYTAFAEQPVGAALLGFDPALTAGVDLVLLAADGEVHPVLSIGSRI
jgi:hypothetical protein